LVSIERLLPDSRKVDAMRGVERTNQFEAEVIEQDPRRAFRSTMVAGLTAKLGANRGATYCEYHELDPDRVALA
jgi:hypothetical protein